MESTKSLIANLRACLSVNGVFFSKVPQKLQQVCVPIWNFGYIVACHGGQEESRAIFGESRAFLTLDSRFTQVARMFGPRGILLTTHLLLT